ncbi:MAG: hypothetical protein AAF412_00745 [Pseudomonadota bacterium]
MPTFGYVVDDNNAGLASLAEPAWMIFPPRIDHPNVDVDRCPNSPPSDTCGNGPVSKTGAGIKIFMTASDLLTNVLANTGENSWLHCNRFYNR